MVDETQAMDGQVSGSGIELAQALTGIAGEPIGQVETLAGTVTAIRIDGTEVTLQEGDSVFQGDTLHSGPDGAIGVVFADETTFSMAESGEIVLDEMVYDPVTQEGTFAVSVVEGVFTFVSGEIAKTDPDAMTLDTPVATIGIRGTQVALKYEEGEDLQVVLMEEADGFVGEVVVQNAAGLQILNVADQGTSVASADSAPSAPSAPVAIDRSDIVEAFGGALKALPESAGANRYGADDEAALQEEAIEEGLTEEALLEEELVEEGEGEEEVAEGEGEIEEEILAEEEIEEVIEEEVAEIEEDLADLEDFTTAAGGDDPVGGESDPNAFVSVTGDDGDDGGSDGNVLVGGAGGDLLGVSDDVFAGFVDVTADDSTPSPTFGGDDNDDPVLVFDAPEPEPEPEPEPVSSTVSGASVDGGIIVGSSGDDVLADEAGDTVIVGGAGDDTAVFEGSLDDYEVVSANDVIAVTHIETGEQNVVVGVEAIQFDDQTVSTADIVGISDQVLTGVDTTAALSADGGFGEGEEVSGTDGDDVLLGTQQPDSYSNQWGSWSYAYQYTSTYGYSELVGGAGDDVLIGGVGDNKLSGGAGDDILLAGTEPDTYDASGSDDYSYSGSYYTYSYEYTWTDHETTAWQELSGGIGDDVLIGGLGSNELSGGDGADVLVGGTLFNTESEQYNYSEYYYESSGSVIYDFAGSTRTYDQRWAENELFGGAGSDLLIGGAGENLLDGGAGDDVVIGGTGELNTSAQSWTFDADGSPVSSWSNYAESWGGDVLRGGSGDDIVVAGGASDASHQIDDWQDFLLGQGGFSEGDFGEGGGDFGFSILEGGRGDDVLVGGAGSDVLMGRGSDSDGIDGINDGLASAQEIPRGAFGVAPNPDLGDDSLPSVSINGFLGTNRDSDFFRVELQAGEKLVLDIDYGEDAGADSVDTMVFVYDANGNQLARDDDASTSSGGGGSVDSYDSYLEFEAQESGVYYFAVTSYENYDPMDPEGSTSGDYGVGDYVLNVSIVPTEGSTGFGDAPATLADVETLVAQTESDNDVIIGGGGSDLFIFSAGDGFDVVADFGADDALLFQGFSVTDIEIGTPDETGAVVIGAGAGDDRIEVRLENQEGQGYSVSEDESGNALVTIDAGTGSA